MFKTRTWAVAPCLLALVGLAFAGACFPDPPRCLEHQPIEGKCDTGLEPDSEVASDMSELDGETGSSDTDALMPSDIADPLDGEASSPEDSGFDADRDSGSTEDLDDDDTEPDEIDVADSDSEDVSVDGADVETTEPVPNGCGGTGAITPGDPGEPCGVCLDGALACDESDPLMRSTLCVGASALNACGGCGGLAEVLGASCGECGLWGCDPSGTTEVACIEPADGCIVLLTCDDLGCAAQGRTCIESDGAVSAECDLCLPDHVLVDDACLPPTDSPTNVTASTDRDDVVEVAWLAATYATSYRVFRCDTEPCGDLEWQELTTAPVEETSFIDTSADGPSAPPAPSALDASDDRTDVIVINWDAVVAPPSPSYRYRVVSVGPAGESEPSEDGTGARTTRPITGYERRVGSGPWEPIPGAVGSSWTDESAPAATLTAPAVSASQGLYATHVRLTATGAQAAPGATRDYQVRAVSAVGPGAASSVATGWRVAGTIAYQWERSAGSVAASFSPLAAAIAANFDDYDAPVDGSVRWYRVVMSAAGASAVTSTHTSGSRLALAGVPGNVSASSDREEHVRVDWSPVSGATSYHVYRDGVKITSGNGTTSTNYSDSGAPAPGPWLAPSNLSRANSADAITVSWTAPAQPLGAEVSYAVSAVNEAGEGALSAAVQGRRSGAELLGYQVEVQPAGGSANWTITGSTAALWVDASAPPPVVTAGTVAAANGAYRDVVRLESTGAGVSTVNVTYRVRGILDGGDYTPISSSVTGARTAGTLSFQWQRSSGTTQTGFSNLPGATSATFDDTTAPSEGAHRWYRLLLAHAADQPMVGPVEGWRLAFNAVDGGGAHACATTTEGRVWCWGNNAAGQLGRGHVSAEPNAAAIAPPASSPKFVGVGAGTGHTCARTDQGDVWCWGTNSNGELGDTTTTAKSTAVKVSGINGTAVSLAVGNAHACVATSGGSALCWGFNEDGQVGNNTTTKSAVPVAVLTAPASPLTGVLSVSAGGSHTCAQRAGDTWCWGKGTYGQLGVEGVAQSSVAINAVQVGPVRALGLGGNHSCARLGTSNAVWCWGRNDQGQLGDGTTVDRWLSQSASGLNGATQVSSALDATCALIGSNVSCWGNNASGTLGIGSTTDSLTPVTISGLSATAIGAGLQFVCAVSNGGLMCWGNNFNATLGDGTTTNRTSPVPVLLPEP